MFPQPIQDKSRHTDGRIHKHQTKTVTAMSSSRQAGSKNTNVSLMTLKVPYEKSFCSNCCFENIIELYPTLFR